ncbi:MAG: pyridoxal phosphate-dependent aminotransferase [Paracoccaceae bacterium]
MSDPRLTPLAASLPASVPFVGPETMERAHHPFRARLGANESAFGPSPRAVAAMADAARDAWMYGDPEAHELRNALAAHHRVPPENLIVGEGIDGLLGLLVRLTVSNTDSVVTSLGAYPTFDYHVSGFGGAIHRVPYRNDMEDADALLAEAAATDAKLIYLSNPDNPMGGVWDAATIESMVARVPDGTLLILDEAYAEFAPGPLPRIDPDDTRVIRLRTFSKAHGLAGARVGYAIGPAPLLSAFDRVRNHFGLSRVSQAGALAALDDRVHLADVIARTARARDRVARIARDCGLTPLPSATNFVAVDCGTPERAGGIMDGLLAAGIFIRKPSVAPLSRCIRIGTGTDRDLDLLARELPAALRHGGAPMQA